MSLTIADIGVISGIMFSLCTVIWVIHKSSINQLNKELEKNYQDDEKRHNGIGSRVEELQDDLHALELKASNEYAKKTELEEVKKEIKVVEKLINANHLELISKLNSIEARTNFS